MSKSSTKRQRQSRTTPAQTTTPRTHDLIAIAQWLPGKPPTNYEREVFDANEYEVRFWRCRKCGQERNRPDEFVEPCPVERSSSPVMEAGYSVEDPRTRRALTEDMTVHFGRCGPTYQVESESGKTYSVDVVAETCTCPDHTQRDVFCKHLRRVDLAIRAGVVPGPDGTFVR